MFLVGDDLSTLNSNANIGFKALAVLDIASNATIFIPVAGEGVEGGKFALKGAFYAGKKLIGKEAIAVSREEAPRIAEQVAKSSNPVEVFERYGNEAEAKASKDANGLVPKPGHEGQPKWIGKPGTTQAKTLGKTKNYTHRMTIETQAGTGEWLQQFEIKANEPGRYAIPADSLLEFNDRVVRVTIKRIRVPGRQLK